MKWPNYVDLHMHSTVSDGTDTPEQLLGRVREAGLDMFSLTDHDAVKGCRTIQELLVPGDPLFVTGVEFSCKDEAGKYHILGYAYDPDAPSMQAVVGKGHQIRLKKVKARLDYLEREYNIVLPKEAQDELFSMHNPGKPHIGNLMVRYGYVQTMAEAIKNYIDKLHIRSEYVRPEEAIEGILGSGGIPVLAHPFYGSGDQLILGAEMEERLKKLMAYGLQGVEVFYSGFSRKLRESMIRLAEKYDLYMSAGSDYHGANKLVVLGDTGCENTAEGPEELKRFLQKILERYDETGV